MSDNLNKHIVWACTVVLVSAAATTGFLARGHGETGTESRVAPTNSQSQIGSGSPSPLGLEIDKLSMKLEALSAQVVQLSAAERANGARLAPTSEEERLRQEIARLQAQQAATRAGAPSPARPGAIDATPGVGTANIENASIGIQVLESLAQLEGALDAPAGTDARKTVTIFFDPRCPYCHQAFKELHGKVAVRWVPVLALGNPSEGTPLALSVLAAENRVDALGRVFDTRKAVAGPEASAELGAKLTENLEAFSAVFAAAGRGLKPGVPTIFVPRSDGRVVIMVGYDKGDDARIRSILEGA